MIRGCLVFAVFLAGSRIAPCQSSFIIHLDGVQAGYDGSGHSVFETSDGYVIFGLQVSDDGTAYSRCGVYRLDQDGGYGDSYLIGAGEPYQLTFGLFDPVIATGEPAFRALVQRYDYYDSIIELLSFDSSGVIESTIPVLTTLPSDSTLVGFRQLRQTVDGGFVFCGFHDTPDSHPKALLVKLDTNGTVQWQQTYDAPGQSYVAISVAQYVDGGYVLAGYRLPESVPNLGFLIRTDSIGNQIWRRHFGGEAGGWCPVRVCADSGIVVLSSYAETGWPWDWQQQLLVKYNPSGGVVWQTRSNYFQNVTAYDLEVLPDQSIIGVGTFSSDIGLTKYSAAGDSLWCRLLRIFQPYAYHSAYDVELASDGGFLLTGQASQDVGDPHPGQETIFVIKTDSVGCVVPGCQNVGVQEYVMDLQVRLRVSPNPAADLVQVALDLPEGGEVQGQVQVQLLDASGRLVLVEPVQLVTSSGVETLNKLSATVNVSALPSGTYYLHLRDAKRWLAGSKVVVE